MPSDLVITPAGGAQKVSYMVSLLTAHRLKVIVLFDEEKQARLTAQELIKQKLIRSEHIVFVSEAFGSGSVSEADIEDLLDPDVFAMLVEETYKKELSGLTLTLNLHIPRIVRRYEDAFKTLGLEFNKTRPAKLFLRRIADDPASVLPPASMQRFKTLFETVVKRHQAQLKAQRKPFE